jgi:hypothetical protein
MLCVMIIRRRYYYSTTPFISTVWSAIRDTAQYNVVAVVVVDLYQPTNQPTNQPQCNHHWFQMHPHIWHNDDLSKGCFFRHHDLLPRSQLPKKLHCGTSSSEFSRTTGSGHDLKHWKKSSLSCSVCELCCGGRTSITSRPWYSSHAPDWQNKRITLVNPPPEERVIAHLLTPLHTFSHLEDVDQEGGSQIPALPRCRMPNDMLLNEHSGDIGIGARDPFILSVKSPSCY